MPGSGAAAHRCAQAASERSRAGWSPAAISSSAAVSGPTPCRASRPGARAGDEGDDELVQALELAVEEFRAPSQLPQRDAGGVADHVARPRPQRRQFADQRGDRVPGEPRAQVTGPGDDQGPGLADGLGPLGAGTALGDHQGPDSLYRAVAAFGCAAGPARLGGAGGADRI